MIGFTDKKLFLKGTCSALAADPVTGRVLYQDNKFTTGNVTTNTNMGEIRAGLGNGIATIIPTDTSVNVDFSSSTFSLWAKGAQVGSGVKYGRPVMRCKVVTADSAEIAVDVSEGKPVAQVGYNKPFAYVQTALESGTIAECGTPYEVDPSSGVIKGFSAERGKKYKIWYFTNQANAQGIAIHGVIDPKIVYFMAQMAVYSNEGALSDNEGTRAGWLYVIVPRLKLGGNGGVNGDQGANDTTSLSGTAVAFDDDVVSDTCSDCDMPDLAYYIYAPDDKAEDIVGLAIVGGVVSMPQQSTKQIPVKLVMANGELVTPNYADLTYEVTTPAGGASVDTNGVVTSKSSAGNGEVTCTLTENPELTVVANLIVEP